MYNTSTVMIMEDCEHQNLILRYCGDAEKKMEDIMCYSKSNKFFVSLPVCIWRLLVLFLLWFVVLMAF